MHLKKLRKPRRTQAELFLDQLSQLAGGIDKPISNKALRNALGWEEDRYWRIHRQLSIQNKIEIGKGYGGSVCLNNAHNNKGLKLFLSYCHTDEAVKNALLKHLKPLQRLGLIETWHDRKIKPGDEWDKVISSNLDDADIVLLLISIDFINSSYCYDIELTQAMMRHESKDARLVPIIIRACMWHDAPFAKLQALPKDGKAVSSWSNEDEALLDIAQGVRNVAEELLAKR